MAHKKVLLYFLSNIQIGVIFIQAIVLELPI